MKKLSIILTSIVAAIAIVSASWAVWNMKADTVQVTQAFQQNDIKWNSWERRDNLRQQLIEESRLKVNPNNASARERLRLLQEQMKELNEEMKALKGRK